MTVRLAYILLMPVISSEIAESARSYHSMVQGGIEYLARGLVFGLNPDAAKFVIPHIFSDFNGLVEIPPVRLALHIAACTFHID